MKKVLVTTDFSDESYTAFPFAKRQASPVNGETGQVHLLNVVEESFMDIYPGRANGAAAKISTIVDTVYKETSGRLRALCREHFQDVSHEVGVLRGKGNVAEQIMKFAQEQEIDLIVIATHGRTGFGRILLGSVAERVIRHTKVPVLIVPTRGGPVNKMRDAALRPHILATTDFSSASLQAFPIVREQVLIEGKENCQLTLLHVAGDLTFATYHYTLGEDLKEILAETEKNAQDALLKLRDEFFVDLLGTTAVIPGTDVVQHDILEFAKSRRVSLIVLASHGKTGLAHFLLGSVTEKIIRESTIPVLVIPTGSQAVN